MTYVDESRNVIRLLIKARLLRTLMDFNNSMVWRLTLCVEDVGQTAEFSEKKQDQKFTAYRPAISSEKIQFPLQAVWR